MCIWRSAVARAAAYQNWASHSEQKQTHPYCKCRGISQLTDKLFQTNQPADIDNKTTKGMNMVQIRNGISCGAYGRIVAIPVDTKEWIKFVLGFTEGGVTTLKSFELDIVVGVQGVLVSTSTRDYVDE